MTLFILPSLLIIIFIVCFWHIFQMKQMGRKHAFLVQFYHEKIQEQIKLKSKFTSQKQVYFISNIQFKFDIIKKQISILKKITH
jgi:hypothetical protein